MALFDSGKKLIEKITGWSRPSKSELPGLIRSRKANEFRISDDGIIPNHPHWPMIIYRGAVRLPAEFHPAAILEDLFESNSGATRGAMESTPMLTITRAFMRFSE